MKTIFLVLVSMICFSCEKKCNETFDFIGEWEGQNTPYPLRLTVENTIIEACGNDNCIKSYYQIYENSLVFGGGTWEILSFDCKNISFQTNEGVFNFKRD